MAVNIISEQPLLSAEVRERLEKIKDKEGELNFRAQKTLDHLQQFSHEQKKAKQVFEALQKLEIPRLRDQHIIKLVDIMPATEADVKITLQGYNVTVTAENMKKIAETIAGFVPAAKK
jgi:DNA-directed RNA polymerase subunit F